MKIFSATLLTLFLIGLSACSNQENAAVEKSKPQMASSSTQSKSKILEPQGAIKNTVLDELQK